MVKDEREKLRSVNIQLQSLFPSTTPFLTTTKIDVCIISVIFSDEAGYWSKYTKKERGERRKRIGRGMIE